MFVLYILGFIARWCPMSPHFFASWAFKLLGLALVSWVTARVGVHRLSPTPSISRCFPFSLHLPLDFIHVSSLRPTYLHAFDRPFTCWWWISRFGIGSATRCCSPRNGAWDANVLKSRLKFLPWPGFRPRTSQSNGCGRYPSTTKHPFDISICSLNVSG